MLEKITFSSLDFKAVILNYRVGEEAVAGIVNLFPCVFFVGAIEFDFEIFTDVDGTDSMVAHMFEGALNGLSLGIEDCLFRRDNDLGFYSIDFEHRMSTGNGRGGKPNFS